MSGQVWEITLTTVLGWTKIKGSDINKSGNTPTVEYFEKLISSRGWIYNSGMGAWLPPIN